MAERRDDEFYVGYLSEVPDGIARKTRSTTARLILSGVALAWLIAWGHGPFRASSFEFGTERSFHGTLYEGPAPLLRMTRPDPAGGSETVSTNLLVDFGKFGAGRMVSAFGDREATATGTLVFRDDQMMLELVGIEAPGILGRPDVRPAPTGPPDQRVLGDIRVTGEIVDSKCHFGVMNPGEGRTHRACAIRCISGGIPPVLRVLVDDGSELYMLLVGKDGRALNRELLEFVALPVRVPGRLERLDDLLVLRIEPDEIIRF
jgi:hypothetical protein